jgi:hypothetical protein
VHLIGSGYGLVPEGAGQRSVVVLQNDLAVKRARMGGLRRVIWLPDGTSAEHAVHQAFIDALHRNADMQYGAELLTGDLEHLRGAVHAALRTLETPRPAKPTEQEASPDRRKLVYVLCDEKDRRSAVPLLKFLVGRGLEAKLPVFAGDAAQVREANRELLINCEAVLLFYGAGDEAWKFHQQNELKKLGAARPGKSPLTYYTYLAEPLTDDKEVLLTIEEPNLIDGLKGFSEVALASFLNSVDPRWAT